MNCRMTDLILLYSVVLVGHYSISQSSIVTARAYKKWKVSTYPCLCLVSGSQLELDHFILSKYEVVTLEANPFVHPPIMSYSVYVIPSRRLRVTNVVVVRDVNVEW